MRISVLICKIKSCTGKISYCMSWLGLGWVVLCQFNEGAGQGGERPRTEFKNKRGGFSVVSTVINDSFTT